MVEDIDYYRDEHVWEYLYNWNKEQAEKNILNITNREAMVMLGIKPSNFDKLTKRSPDMEREWLLQTIKMFRYYNFSIMNILFDKAIELSSYTEYELNKNFDSVIHDLDTKESIKKKDGKFKREITSRLKISDVIKKYGFKIKGNKIICPFHPDKEPSLSFSDKKNTFFCFGCRAKGDIIEFERRLNS